MFDVFVKGRYRHTVSTTVNEHHIFNEKELIGLVESRYPYLKHEKWTLTP